MHLVTFAGAKFWGFSIVLVGLSKPGIRNHISCLSAALKYACYSRIGPQDILYETLPMYHIGGNVLGFGIVLVTGTCLNKITQDVHLIIINQK